MQVADVMTRGVHVCHPGHAIRDCAGLMAQIDSGVLPVHADNRLVGMITDRDIAVRAVAAGKGPETAVSEVMSRGVLYCFDDQDLDHVARSMGKAQVRRVPVVDRQKRLIGILSLGDIARKSVPAAGEAVRTASKRGGPHSQTTQR